jgi:hypothetical protein
MSEVIAVPQAVQYALARGMEPLSVRLAILWGQRDENKLTNMVFFARHPERDGRKLTRDEPEFALLSQEWLAIRDELVRPALAASTDKPSPTTGRPAPGWVRDVAAKLNRYRGDIPLDLLLGWIKRESGGRNDIPPTSLDERGYFQLHPGESKTLKVDHERLSVDPDYSLQAGLQLVRYYASRAQQLGFTYGSELFWRMVKFLHALGSGAVPLMLQQMRNDGIDPTVAGWEGIKQYAITNRARLMDLFSQRFGRAFDPTRFTANVDKVFEEGGQLVAAGGVQ